MHDLYDEGYIGEASLLEFLHSHSSVVYQPDFNSPYYSGINPYALGFNIFMDVKRMCENPTEEDKEWFPDIAGTEWLPVFKHICENFKDDSFILQYLSPKVMRDMKLFNIHDEGLEAAGYEVTHIHDDEGYRSVRSALSASKSLYYQLPEIYVKGSDLNGERDLVLVHNNHYGDLLDAIPSQKTLKHIANLWRFPVYLELPYEMDVHGKLDRVRTMPDAK
jgi:spore cortex formation protein SpoVR/YcgB (stage V sporulation)